MGYAVLRTVASLALIGFLVLYAISPAWLGVLSAPIPDWLRGRASFWGAPVLRCMAGRRQLSEKNGCPTCK